MAKYTLMTLPETAKKTITLSYTQTPKDGMVRGSVPQGMGLFGASAPEIEKSSIAPGKEIAPGKVFWATDNYSEKGHVFNSEIPQKAFSLIVPRTEKAKAEQKKRTKEKAEVFTPSWVCNLQNNLIDDHVLYEGAFNTAEHGEKTWTPSEGKVRFEGETGWLEYVLSRRLEITCGEGPYLMSPYDTTTGEKIPVRDSEGRYARIGLLDRKFRVIAENVEKDDWVYVAKQALSATYGYEWQGDNLLLARLNMINTFIDYYEDFFGENFDNDELVGEVAEIASWQLWQMDGLKMVAPETCSDDCEACATKARIGHNGKLSLIEWGEGKIKTFESMIPVEVEKEKQMQAARIPQPKNKNETEVK